MLNLNQIVIAAFIFVIGLVVGSFMNVMIFRIPKKESIAFPPSHCPACGHRLSVYDLVPVFSWLFLKGKCRYCHAPISKQYPLIELLTGVSFVCFYLLFGWKADFIVSLVLYVFLITILCIDFRYFIVPNILILFMLPIAIVIAYINIQNPVFTYAGADPLSPLYGGLIGAGILFSISLLGYFMYGKREVMGLGDVKLLLVLGILCGLQNILFTLLLSVILGAIVSIYLILCKDKDKRDKIAFAPFLICSFFIVIFTNYFNLF